MPFSSKQNNIGIEDIYAKTSEEGVLAYYFNIKEIPCLINSPLREDTKPSFSLFYDRNGKVKWKDFATGEYGNLWELFRKYWGLPFDKVLLRIYKEITDNKEVAVRKTTYKKGCKHSDKTLQVKIREWKDYDFKYWETYGISRKFLKFGAVYPISHIFLTENGKTKTFLADKYAYVYIEKKDNKTTIKVYQPFNKEFKWFNNHNSSVWDLWRQLPEKGDKLIITSSRKDALTIWENVGIPSISMQAESVLPKPQVIQELKDRFKKVYVLYDNDYTNPGNPGRNFGKKLSEMYGLIQIELPEEYKSKDSSDFVKNHGRSALKEIIQELIK